MDFDLTQAEKFKSLHQRLDAINGGIAGYLAVAGAIILIVSASGADVGLGSPQTGVLLGLSLCVGGGIYWLDCRSKQKKIRSEMRGIEEMLASRGKRIDMLGRMTDL